MSSIEYRRCQTLLLCLLSIVLSARVCSAEQRVTLEYACVKSSVVVMAHIIDYQVHERHRYGFGHHRLPVTVRLKATRWFKGRAVDELSIQHIVFGEADELSELQEAGKIPELDRLISSSEEKIWYLSGVTWPDAPRQSQAPLAVFDLNQADRVLQVNRLDCFTCLENGLQFFRGDEELLDALERICSRDDSFLDRFNIWDPVHNDEFRPDVRSDYVYVLGGKQLEQTARRLVLEPGSFISSDAGSQDLDFRKAMIRYAGIEILTNFRSTENILLLRELQEDPGWWIRANETEGYTKEYFVRRRAFEVLRRWGQDVSPPGFLIEVMDEVQDGQSRVVPFHLSALAWTD